MAVIVTKVLAIMIKKNYIYFVKHYLFSNYIGLTVGALEPVAFTK